MNKVFFFLLSMWMLFACSEDKEIPKVDPPVVNPGSNEKPKPVVVDSIYYQLNVDGFELVAATEDSTCLFLQTDTTFAFKCLFDSCGSNRLVAYCDSIGLVERIVADDQVVNVLHHEDKKKMDIFYKDAEGKMAWIKDVDSPYKDLSSRAEGDVPYSAISVVNDLSYAVYTILNTYDIDRISPLRKYAHKYARKETYNMRGTVALELIKQILGTEYKIAVFNDVSQIVNIMSDYATWVKEELYGDAIPHLRKYASRLSINNLMLNVYVDGVDSLANEFKVGIIVAEEGEKLDALHFLNNQGSQYNSQKVNYPCSFKGLATGKRYRFKPYLAPASTSKYLTGMKSLLDYYKYGTSEDYLLLETKAEFKSMEDDQATIKLSVENADKRIKMGVIYSEHSNMLKHEYKKVEYEPTFKEGVLSDNFEKEVKIETSESGYTYYMPYVIYDDDILNRPLDYSISSETIYETDMIFYGKKDSINIDPLRKALMQLYKSTNGDNWTHNDNWGSDKPVTEWYGVTFSNIDSTYLVSLIGNNLTGRIEQVFPKDYKIELRCSNNQLVFIDVSKSTSLIRLDCDNNLLTSLNVSDCTNLENIVLSYNQLNEFRHSGCKALNEVIMNESFAKQTATRSANQQASLDFSDSPVLYTLDCDGNQLASLEVSNCTALHHLSCSNNQLTSLDLSNCNLFRLDCDKNKLLSLDLSSCTNLYYLDCNHNRSMTSLNIANCTGLYDFMCCDNKLTSLDLSNFTKLERLYCFSGSLISLNVSGCVALAELYCHDNQLTYLDVSGCTVLSELLCAKNQLSSLDVSSCIALSHLDCESNLLTNLHVSNNEVLYLLDCSYNQLASLDVSNHKVLEVLRCYNNRLTSLDVDGCTALESLSCEENKITRFIPDWFSQLDYFSYDKRFEYWRDYIDGSTYEIKHKDKGIGWSYKDEPNAKYSGF